MSTTTQTYADRLPGASSIVKSHLGLALVMLIIGGFFGLIQTLHRTGFFRGFIDSSQYYTVLTAHGVFLAIAFTIFFLVGFYHWAVTDELGREAKSTKLSWLWTVLMQVGAVFAAIAILGGFMEIELIGQALEADTLYTFYAPLSTEAHPLFFLGLVLFIVGTWFAGLDWILTWLDWKQDNPGERIPLRTFMVLTTMLMWYIATIGVAVSVLAFLLPASLGIHEQVNTLLTRTLFWYFAHPIVYFWLMPAYVMWYTILPKLAGGRLFSDPLARIVFILFLILSTPVGIHHQYLDPGIAEGFKYIAMTNTMFLLLPSLLTAFTVVASIEHGARQRGGEGLLGWLGALPWRDPAFAGMSLAGLMFAAGGFSGMVNAGMNLNYLVHNSMWVPGHFHLTVGTAVALTMMAGMYWLLPQLTGKGIVFERLGLAQVVTWFVGMVFMSNAMHRGGVIGLPRRTAEPTYGAASGDEFFEWTEVVGGSAVGEVQFQIALGGTLLFVSLVLFAIVMIATLVMGSEAEVIPDSTMDPLSDATHGPAVLDNLKLWVGIAVVLVVLAYALPLMAIVDRGGVLGEAYGFIETMSWVIR